MTTEEERTAAGEIFAKTLQLRKSRINKGRYQTEIGDKTPLGIFYLVQRIGRMAIEEDFATIKKDLS